MTLTKTQRVCLYFMSYCFLGMAISVEGVFGDFGSERLRPLLFWAAGLAFGIVLAATRGSENDR